MPEYWINVYPFGKNGCIFGSAWTDVNDAIFETIHTAIKSCYRIHVRMK